MSNIFFFENRYKFQWLFYWKLLIMWWNPDKTVVLYFMRQELPMKGFREFPISYSFDWELKKVNFKGKKINFHFQKLFSICLPPFKW